MTRLDQELVARGLARSRTQAQALVREGHVHVAGQVVTRASHQVDPSTDVALGLDAHGATEGESRWIARGWVGRGAVKLEHALGVWGPAGLDPRGRRCLDVGASTGGFTQVLLEAGAEQVLALDVGHDQLHPDLAADPRVTDLSGTHVRDLTPELVGGPVAVVVCDVSFISLTQVLGPVSRVLDEAADVVVLVKPQFEVGRERLARDGVVRSAEQRLQALRTVTGAARAAGLVPVAAERSPVRGGAGTEGAGNVEYLLWLRPARGMMEPGPSTEDLDAQLVTLTQEEDR